MFGFQWKQQSPHRFYGDCPKSFWEPQGFAKWSRAVTSWGKMRTANGSHSSLSQLFWQPILHCHYSVHFWNYAAVSFQSQSCSKVVKKKCCLFYWPHHISSLFINLSGSVEGTVQPALCPAGYYCPPGLTLGWEFPCPPGTVQSQLGASSLEACLPCPAGMEIIHFCCCCS